MVRKIVAHKHLLDYLINLANSHSSFTIGLVIGQPFDDKDYVLHFAKTQPTVGDESPKLQHVKTLAQFPEQSVGEHAEHVTRMLSGGLYVLGVFLVTDEQVLQPLNKKVVSILKNIHAHLDNNPLLWGNSPSGSERIILHFASKTRQFAAKNYNFQSGKMDLVNLVFSEKEPLWCSLECKFDINETVPILQGQQTKTLKTQMKAIVANLSEQLKSATFIFDGKVRNAQESIGNINHHVKKKHVIVIDEAKEEKSIQVSLLLPTSFQKNSEAETVESYGILRIIGQICSSIWLNPNTSFALARIAVIEDIVRSFQARLCMHFDSLIEGEGGTFNDKCSLHEPPRRVTIDLPECNASLSDYLFPGEGAQDAQLSFQDVLDVTVKSKSAIRDPEGQADLSSYYSNSESCSRESAELPLPKLPADTNKLMYIVGTSVALTVLILSLLIHFLRE